MDFFDKLTGKDKEKKKKKGIVGKIITFITVLSALPVIFNILLILLALALIFLACAGIMQYFQEEEPIVGAYDIDWGNYTCTCTFLTAEQILQVQAGNSVDIDLNAGSLNISGAGVSNVSGEHLSGYTFGGYPMEYFVVSASYERGTSDEKMKKVDGDSGKAYGPCQMDYRYHLVSLMKHMYNRNPDIWSGLAPYLNSTNGDESLKATGSKGKVIRQIMEDVYTQYPQIYVDDYFTYVYDKFVKPVIDASNANGVDLTKYHPAVLSGAVGGSVWTGSAKKVVAGLTTSMTAEEMVNKIHDNIRNTKNPNGFARWNGIGGGGQQDFCLMWVRGQWDATQDSPSLVLKHGSGWSGSNSVRIASGIPSSSLNNTTNSTTSSFGSSSSSTNNTINESIDESNDTVLDSNTGVTSTTLTFTNGQKIGLDSGWKYANESVINSGSATYYTATSNRKDICVAVNAGHGCRGGDSKKTKSHPDGTGKYTSGTTAAGGEESVAISSGMTFKDGTSEASVNLLVAKAMKDELLSMGYDVLMIRESDNEQLDNIARTVISNNVADAHVAIHFDSSENNIGAYYMAVVDNDAYKNMEPVKTWWKQHDELGEALLVGLSNNGSNVRSNHGQPSDLTQTSYSTIPSVDVELGDKITPHSVEDCNKFGVGLALGVDEFFKTHNPVNQSKRLGSVLSNSDSTGNTNSKTSTNISNTVVGGLVNKNKGNLRTQCSMESEGLCGCYVSDPNCACHIFGGSDGILGNDDDDNTEAIEEVVQESTYSGLVNVVDSTAKQVMKDMYLGLNSAYQNGYFDIYCCKIDGKGKVYACPHSKCKTNFILKKLDGSTVNKSIRTDCSAYAGMVLAALGAEWSGLGSGTSAIMGTDGGPGWMENVIISDKFVWLAYSPDTVEPGDFVVRSGHIEIFMGWADKATNAVYKYSWGSSGSVYNIMPNKSTGDVDAKNMAQTDSGYSGSSSGYTWIIRYVGSGGQGK